MCDRFSLIVLISLHQDSPRLRLGSPGDTLLHLQSWRACGAQVYNLLHPHRKKPDVRTAQKR